MEKQTRSGRVYRAFEDVAHHGLVATDFDFASELRNALQRVAEQDELGDDAPLSQDPLPALDDFSPFGSPLSSISSSGWTSRSSSPMPERGSQSPPRKILRTLQQSAQTLASPRTASSDAPPPPSSSGRKARKKRRARERKKAKEAAKKAQARAEGTQFRDAFTYKIRIRLSSKYQEVLVISCDVDASKLSHASTSYIGGRQMVEGEAITLESLLGEGFRLIEWDGHMPILITDREGRVIVILAGRPTDDDSWDKSMERLQEALADTCEALHFGRYQCVPAPSGGATENRRGDFKTAAMGVSFGGGQKVPGNLQHSAYNQGVLDRLLRNSDLRRLVGFGNATLAFYAPRIYGYYRRKLGKLYRRHSRLRRIFRGTLYPAISVNFGPSVVTVEHQDSLNLAGGICMIHSGGCYDPKKGGQLYLRQLGLVIEFPPNSTIGIPSASIGHGNIPIQKGETRTSITQYAAGGLFRWVDNGFRSTKALEKEDAAMARRIVDGSAKRWRKALGRFSKVSNLHRDRLSVFYNQ